MLVYFRSERVLCVWGAVYRVMGRKSIVGKINVVFGYISCVVVLLELLYIILFLDLLVCCNGVMVEGWSVKKC